MTLNEPPVPQVDRAAALAKAKAPGIALVVTGAIGLLLTLANFTGAPQGAILSGYESAGMPKEMLDQMRASMDATSALGIVSGIFGLAVQALVLVGGLQLAKLGSHGLAMTGAILALIPCFGCCCVGIPVGIWALVAMQRADVRPAFSG